MFKMGAFIVYKLYLNKADFLNDNIFIFQSLISKQNLPENSNHILLHFQLPVQCPVESTQSINI